MKSLTEFQREGDSVVKDLGLALQRSLMEFRDPKAAAQPFESRYTRLEAEMKAFAKETPHAADYVEGFLKLLRDQMDELKRRAQRAHSQRPEVDGRFKRQYNQVVGEALADAPKQATDALRGQVRQALRKMIDQALPGSEVPSDVKATMTRELSGWLERQEFVEDSYFVVERAVTEVATYLHQRLTIKGEIDLTRKTLIRDPKVSKAVADAADQRVGELGKRAKSLDSEIAQRIERSTRQVRGSFDLRPNLVLDPARRFVKDIELRAGIKITNNDVRVDLGTKLKVLSPLTNDRSYQAQAYANTQVGNNLSFGVSGGANFGGPQGQQEHYEVKATLSWRF